MSQFPVPVEPAQAARPVEMSHQHPGNLASIIRRIEDAIDIETAGIRSDLNFDIAASAASLFATIWRAPRYTAARRNRAALSVIASASHLRPLDPRRRT